MFDVRRRKNTSLGFAYRAPTLISIAAWRQQLWEAEGVRRPALARDGLEDLASPEDQPPQNRSLGFFLSNQGSCLGSQYIYIIFLLVAFSYILK